MDDWGFRALTWRMGMVAGGRRWDGGVPGPRATRKAPESCDVGWDVLATRALVRRVASAKGPLARSFYPATCTGGRSAPPLDPPGGGAEHPLPPLIVTVIAAFSASATAGVGGWECPAPWRGARSALLAERVEERGSTGRDRRRPWPRSTGPLDTRPVPATLGSSDCKYPSLFSAVASPRRGRGRGGRATPADRRIGGRRPWPLATTRAGGEEPGRCSTNTNTNTNTHTTRQRRTASSAVSYDSRPVHATLPTTTSVSDTYLGRAWVYRGRIGPPSEAKRGESGVAPVLGPVSCR